METKRKKKDKKTWRLRLIVILGSMIGLCSLVIYLIVGYQKPTMPPDEVLLLYMDYIKEGAYDQMYDLLDVQSQEYIDEETFINKNKNIYEGIEATKLEIFITEVVEQDKNQTLVYYDTYMDTLAGDLFFSNKATLSKNENKEYKLKWYTQLIFPNLNPDDKVRVRTLKGERGNIYDRKGVMLAGEGVASLVGIVPGKMGETKETDIEKIGELLGVSAESIHKKLDASYVKEDTFVPIKKVPKDAKELEEALLEIKGIKITDTPVRVYPLGESTSHLTGYIQNVNAEDLEKLEGKGYNANSVIGRAGLEKLYEDELRGIDGYEIVIVNEKNEVKQTLATKKQRNGQSIHLTIDAQIQSTLYTQLQEDKGAAVAMNPYTGEVLALVSTPSFNSNDFVLGMSTSKWEALNTDPKQPLFNRFRATLVPGSGFKSVIGAIGLTNGVITPEDNLGYAGRSWQKDASWGSYKVTTLKDYGPEVVLRNALIYSDNIYFAKLALKIGPEMLARELEKIGFNETIPFEIGLYSSSFSNTDKFDSEIQLADSGYGQAQILVNPVHMASIYSAFVNEGNMIKPYLVYEADKKTEYWKTKVFTKEAAQTIREDLVHVVEQAGGGIAKVDGVKLAGKTGTAEIKQSKDDYEGTELGWFNVSTVDEEKENGLLVISMVEDVKGRGGAGYVISKVKPVFEMLKK